MFYSTYKNTYSKNSMYIITPICVLYGEKLLELKAFWDTGASHTHISQRVIDILNLKPKRKVKTLSHHGNDIVNVYTVTIMLPTDYMVVDIDVLSESQKILDTDVVVGMDIISNGDFHMDYTGERPVFTFKHPNPESEKDTFVETELY